MNEKYVDIDFAKLDIERQKRRGCSEAVFCECKTEEQLVKIFSEFQKQGQNVLGTRVTQSQVQVLQKKFSGLYYNSQARIVKLIQKEINKYGEIAICTGGTGDIPVAEEAAETAEFYGSNVKKYYDIGVAGIHRLFDKIDDIRKANVIIAVAGMEGALGGIIAGLVDVPVIAVPTSVGYGSSFAGLSALLTMLNSCAEGMTVVNIDNGFNAGYSANQINRKISGEK
ncbi:nickel pincer cofactor biosynthesis protein LarB [Spirochaetes bacterium]|uniref:Nickel pincer cofactor biosynthesis protein LarB n=1 Tax=Candidatus Scatousia excrementipullorum TaxID=2840936 RepID=A0A9D9DRI3_9BACT|nr:nickel pincer cofactor biosynthesis protein LarB [Candidatus Scatousia excrementipullorum]